MNNTQRTGEPENPWLDMARQIFAALASQPGVNLAARGDDAEAEEAAIERRGYAEALRPLEQLVRQGKVMPTDARLWQVVFQIRGGKYRPKFLELREMVALKFGLDPDTFAPKVLPGSEVMARTPLSRPDGSVLGIPGVTVKAAYRDVQMPKQTDIEFEDVPATDTEGNIIGDGRRLFLMALHRAKGGHHPDPLMSRRTPGEKVGEA